MAYLAWLEFNEPDPEARKSQEKIAIEYASGLVDRYVSTTENVMRLLKDVVDQKRYRQFENRIFFDIKPIFDKLVARVSDPVEFYFRKHLEVPPYTGLAMSRLNRILAVRANPIAM